MNNNTAPQYEIYALRYASMERTRRENFIGTDIHDGPMPMDFFVWVITSENRTVLVDTGFSDATARARRRNWLRCPIASLSVLGLAAKNIYDVVLTHLHYDHAGNIDRLPNARFHVQDAEVEYATGRYMCHPQLRHTYSVADVNELVKHVYADHVVFHSGDDVLAPGIELLHIGGHTKGLQAVRVNTARGPVVLASDAAHYYANMIQKQPFPIVHDVAAMLEGHGRVCRAAGSLDHVIPGHDPAVLTIYPRLEDDAVGIARLHVAPSERAY